MSYRSAGNLVCEQCRTTILKEDLRLCPNCGAPLPGIGPAPRSASQLGGEQAQYRDAVGAGRYVINFLLAGVIGLGLSYFLRNEGWLATWISAAVMVLGILLIAIAVR